MNAGPNGTGTGVPIGSTYTAVAAPFQLTSFSGAVLLSCDAAQINGQTTDVVGGTGSPSAGLSVTSGTFSTCSSIAGSTTVTAVASPPWLILPTNPPPSGTSLPFGPFPVAAKNVRLNVGCGSTVVTYSGNVTTNTTFNDVNPGSQIQFSVAGSLTAASGGCGLPASIAVNAAFALKTVAGSPVTTTNNWWLKYS